jgi:hypothetical protein
MRFSNLPLPLISPLHKNLVDDLKWAQQDGEGLDLNFKPLTHVLLLTTASTSSSSSSSSSSSRGGGTGGGGDSSGSSSSSAPAGSKNIKDVTGMSTVLFDNFEDDVFFQQAQGALAWQPSVSKQTIVAALVPINKLNTCLSMIDDLI